MNETLLYASDHLPLVLRGIQTATIRPGTRLLVGDWAKHEDSDPQLLPTKHRTKVTAVRMVKLGEYSCCLPVRIWVDGKQLDPTEMRALAARTGFGGAVVLMLQRMKVLHGLPFTGVLVEWDGKDGGK